MTDSNIPVFRAQLRYDSVDEFIEGYSQFVLPDKMFIPLDQAQLKPVDSRVRFEFKLADGSRAMVGEGLVRQVRGPDQGAGPTGLVVEYTHLSRRSKQLVGQIVDLKRAQARAQEPAQPEDEPQARGGSGSSEPTAATPPETPEQDSTKAAGPADPPPLQSDAQPAAEPSEESPEDKAPVNQPRVEQPPDPKAQYEEFNDLDDISDAYGRQPQQVGETEGGLQIMAYDDMSEEDAQEFAEFALGSDEDDVDEMFDDVFAGGEDGDDLFGGGGGDAGEAGSMDEMFGGGEQEATSLDAESFSGGESGLSELSGEMARSEPEPTESAFENDDPSTIEADTNPDSIADPAPETDPDTEPESVDDPAPEPDTAPQPDEGLDPQSQPESEPGALGGEETSVQAVDEPAAEPEPTPDPQPTPESTADQESAASFDSGGEPASLGAASDSRFASGFGEEQDDADELDQALDSLEEESDEERELSLNLGGGTPDDGSDAHAEDSLEALIADEQRNLKEKEGDDEDKDALDEVLGKDNTPAPPSDDFEIDLNGDDSDDS